MTTGYVSELVQLFQEKPRLAIMVVFICIFYAAVLSGYYSAHHAMTEKLVEMQNEQTKLRKLNAEILAGNFQCKAEAEAIEAEIDKDKKSGGFPYLSLIGMLSGCVFIAKFFLFELALARKKFDEVKGGFTVGELAQYRLDHYFSTSKLAKPALLLSCTFMLILLGGGALTLASGDDVSSSLWTSWTYVADPGTHADAEGTLVRLVSFCITIGGMLVFALMIGIISESIGEMVDELKKGKSRVIESEHTLLLGWNDKALAIIQQLALANASEGGGVVVVLSDNEKEEMEDTLSAAVEAREHSLQLNGTHVVFRCGNPLLEHELNKVSVRQARAIICLSPDRLDPDEADSRMVRQVLSLKGVGDLAAHIVVELQDVDNKELISLIAPDLAEVIVAHDIIGRLMIQCARQPGLAHVLENLMGFDGDEFYIQNWPQLEGVTFGNIICRFDDAVPIGIKRAEDGQILINPPDDHMIEAGDEILVLAEDNDSYQPNDGTYPLKGIALDDRIQKLQMKERMLFCGWRRDMADMILELDAYVAPGSELWLLNAVPVTERYEMLKDKGNKAELNIKNLVIKNAYGNPIVRRDLMKLIAVDENGMETDESVTLDCFDSLLVLADAVAIEKGADMESSDSRSLACLLIIQDIQRKLCADIKHRTGEMVVPCDPIAEILDTRTRSLLQVVDCKGYVMSNQIVSAAISQVAECRDMNKVLGELLSADGNEPYLKDALEYTKYDGEKLSFWDISLRARKRSEICIGYKPKGVAYPDSVETLLNPPRKAEKRSWHAGDMLVIIAEN